MLPQIPTIPLNSESKAEKPTQKRSPANSVPYQGIKKVFRRLRIGQKISYGYALAIGIAIVGTAVGLGVGDFLRKEAIEQLMIAKQQQDLLQNLQNATLQAQSHASRLPAVMGNLVVLKSENDQFLEQIDRAKTILLEIQSLVETHREQFGGDGRELQDLLKKYAFTLDYYTQQTELLLKQADVWNINPNKLESAQLQILRHSSSKEALILDQLSSKLTQMIAEAEHQKQQGVEAVENSERLRARIIIGSMLISSAIAALLAYYTSRAIAKPLETVTQVAQQATRESNFKLQATVTAEDEVGILASSFNQLIQRVSDYTQELKQTQTQLIQTEKMSSLGQMVAGVAHEINNPINFIKGNIDYANKYIDDLLKLINLYQEQYPTPNPTIQKQLEDIELDFLKEDLPKTLSSMTIGAERIRELGVSLRNFSRLDEAEMKLADIHAGIDSTLLILNYRLKHGIQVIKHYGNLPQIECYSSQLNQVFMNIISNALDALEEAKSSNPHSPQKAEGDLPTIWIHTEASSQHSITVKIKDNGPGIQPSILKQIFDPFFTTKCIGKGTGLGLAISYQIIAKHHGQIEVNSELIQGTEFTITLPVEATQIQS